MQIANEAEYDAALNRAWELMDAGVCPCTPESMELEQLAHAIEAYEVAIWRISPPTQDEAREFRREQEGT